MNRVDNLTSLDILQHYADGEVTRLLHLDFAAAIWITLLKVHMRREIQCDSPWPRDQLLQLMKVGDFGTKEILLRNVGWPTIPWTVIPLHFEETKVRSLTALLQTSCSSAWNWDDEPGVMRDWRHSNSQWTAILHVRRGESEVSDCFYCPLCFGINILK